jgi:hypothetical protein
MIKLSHHSLVRTHQLSYRLTSRPNRTYCPLAGAFPVKIIRVTVEKMIKRIIHISQPNHFWCGGGQTDAYCVGVDDTDDGVVCLAFSCVVLILILYALLVFLRKYEKEHDRN